MVATSRGRLLAFFAGVAAVAVIAGVVTAFVIAGRGGGSEELPGVVKSLATQAADGLTREAASPTPDPRLGTPVPRESLHPVMLMFCEPLQPGNGNQVAVVASGVQVAYEPGTCQPDVDDSGAVAVRNADGTQARSAPTYVDAQAAPRDNIVWTPAKGTLNGAQVVMTGKYLKADSQVVLSPLGNPLVTFSMTDDGRQVFGSLSERLIGYPLATFLDGEPLHGADGHVIAPTIQSRITESGQTTGLSLDDAKRLAALIDYGYAQ